MLVRIGAVQAMAAPAPILFNILRRETVEPSLTGPEVIRSPPFEQQASVA
jgi:hypothetical protein